MVEAPGLHDKDFFADFPDPARLQDESHGTASVWILCLDDPRAFGARLAARQIFDFNPGTVTERAPDKSRVLWAWCVFSVLTDVFENDSVTSRASGVVLCARLCDRLFPIRIGRKRPCRKKFSIF